MTVKSAKAKARRLQQWVVNAIYELVPELEKGDVSPAIMGEPGEDIKLSPAARRKFPYSVECKARKSFALYADYEQARANAPSGMEPIVIFRADHKKPLVALSAEHFLRLLLDNGK